MEQEIELAKKLIEEDKIKREEIVLKEISNLVKLHNCDILIENMLIDNVLHSKIIIKAK